MRLFFLIVDLKSRINICKSTIEDAFNEGWHDTLYYYIKLRATYEKPIFYNFTNRKTAKIIGVSPSVVCKHIKIILEKNLAHITDGHLQFYSLNKILKRTEDRQSVINLPVWSEKRKMIDELRGVLLVQRLNNQLVSIHNKNTIVKKLQIANAVISKKEIKFLKENGGSKKLESSINNRVTLSNKSIGETFNRSQSSGKLYQKRLNQMGILKSKAKITIIMFNFHSEMLRYAPSKFFCTKNMELARQDSNTIWSPYMKSYRGLLDSNPIEVKVGKEKMLIRN